MLSSCISIRSIIFNAKAIYSDINNLVMGYLISEGYPEAATKFASEANITQTQGDTENIQERVEIRNAILSGDIEPAIERINDLVPDVSTLLYTPYQCALIINPISCTTLTPHGSGEKQNYHFSSQNEHYYMTSHL